MNTAIRVSLAVAGLVAVGEAAALIYFVFMGAAGCAGGRGRPADVFRAAVVDQAAFVSLGYFLLCVGYLFGVRAVVRRRWNVPTKLHHLLIAAVLATATVTVIGTPFLFAG